MIKIKIGNNYKYTYDNVLSDNEVSNTWRVHAKKESETESGLRLPQFGALSAIQAHWTVSCESVTVVMPTGTGKTETMIATIANEKVNRAVVVVPSNLLREQTVDKFCTFGILKEIGVIDEASISPTVVLLKSSPKSEDEINELLQNVNVVVLTMSLAARLPEKYCDKLVKFAQLLIVDEAHHIAATSWLCFKNKFKDKKVLQFTATPFRNDGKKVDGKIIYNYPLYKAQEEGYFQKIRFYPIHEFNENNGDLAIARKAIECLEKDIQNEKEHIVLVRTTTIKRARQLYVNIYQKYYSKYNPVLIVSDLSAKEKKAGLARLKSLESRVVVCVDMFGEGIDIPNLKIAAIHDKYMSLPITLQFVGRFARTKKGLGDASVITNIADESLKESLNDLYAQDSDWNVLLADKSEKAISREMTLQELEKGFRGSGVDGINIKQLMPKVSMQAFHVKNVNPYWDNWKKVFNEEKCKYYFNEEKSILILIEASETKIEWSNYKEISNLNWELHMIYLNKDKQVVFVYSSVKGSARKIVDGIFHENDRICGEKIFRCLYGINRLMLGTVGLNSAINGPIRYKMFAGVDIAQGLSEAQKSTSTKSNLFGIGYDGKGKVSIGCSYKGTIWSRWVESIDFWMDWCNQTINKVLDSSIDVTKLLEGVLIPKEVTKIPDVKAYRIDWPIDLDLCNEQVVYLENEYYKIPIYDSDIKLIDSKRNDGIYFVIETEQFREIIKLSIDEKGYYFQHMEGNRLSIHMRKKQYDLVEFFQDNPPRIKFVNQSTLEGNYYVTLAEKKALRFDEANIERWNWKEKGVDIRVESQGLEKKQNSIQYCVINYLKNLQKYDVIFDDDNSGEIADIVTIKILDESIGFEFYHCKYSHEENPGHRVADLYEVCGQAEKSVEWKQDMSKVVERMIKRENSRVNANKTSRFEVGNYELLGEIKNRLKVYPTTLKIFIVQPGVAGDFITEDMNQVLMASKTYLQETYGIGLGLICS